LLGCLNGHRFCIVDDHELGQELDDMNPSGKVAHYPGLTGWWYTVSVAFRKARGSAIEAQGSLVDSRTG
jgi:hypothetical protein